RGAAALRAVPRPRATARHNEIIEGLVGPPALFMQSQGRKHPAWDSPQPAEVKQMGRGDLHAFVHGLCRRLQPDGSGPSDGELLGRWLACRDEAAFELLLRRHGPLVLGVCRRLLHHPQDVEDAFQAAFLLLVRKAGSIRRREAVASWLYKVAYRVCLRARGARRADGSASALEALPAPADDAPLWRDLRPVLDEEVNALPV